MLAAYEYDHLYLVFSDTLGVMRDLAEQIVKALPAERYEVTAAFLRGKPAPGEPVSRAAKSVYFEFSDKSLKGLRLRAMWQLYKFCRR